MNLKDHDLRNSISGKVDLALYIERPHIKKRYKQVYENQVVHRIEKKLGHKLFTLGAFFDLERFLTKYPSGPERL